MRWNRLCNHDHVEPAETGALFVWPGHIIKTSRSPLFIYGYKAVLGSPQLDNDPHINSLHTAHRTSPSTILFCVCATSLTFFVDTCFIHNAVHIKLKFPRYEAHASSMDQTSLYRAVLLLFGQLLCTRRDSPRNPRNRVRTPNASWEHAAVRPPGRRKWEPKSRP
ncbi:hypothetical protein B0J17DRAFT_764208 [Rhizoctonia solani]|nr:hypothetical protein B0J17DRAFT_764208 [Rhizoctonia solani]